MAEKLPRVTAKIFASNAAEDDIGQYGSALAGNKVLTSDISEIQALPAYETGWRGAVLSTRNYPTLQEMNGLQKTFSQQIAYLLETGLPEWDENTTYWANTSFCQFDGKIYQSLTDNNIGNNPTTDTTNWQYINFNGANQDLSNLSDLGIDFINQSKALKTGVVSENPIILKEIQERKHSTFDISKFQIVGNPTITPDGIASGFSNTNLVKTYVLDTTKKNFCIKLCNFLYKGGAQCFILGTNLSINSNSFDLIINSNRLGLYLSSVGNNWNIANLKVGISTFQEGTSYDISLVRENGNVYKVIVYNHSTNIETTEIEVQSDLDLFASSSKINIASIGGGWTTYTGSIDLKEFSITVDGNEVFNGNKTGVATVMPDNYTVVGNPTITDIGLCQCSSGNYIKGIALSQLLNKSWIMYGRVLNPLSNNWRINCVNSYDVRGSVSGNLNSNNELLLSFRGKYGDSSEKSAEALGPAAVNIGNGFSFLDTKWEFNYSSGIYTLYYKKNGLGDWIFGCSYTPNTPNKQLYDIAVGGSFNIYNVLLAYPSDVYPALIDLNEFKIYVDGSLAYQPCLKIPYTIAGNAKIVDAQYRDRVQEVYELNGYAPYYTIDEENKNFTLPMGVIIDNKQDVLTAGNNITIDNNVISASSVGYNSVGGCILEAPNGVLQVENSGKTIRIPQNLKCLVADGKNPDNTLNGFEIINPNDIKFNVPAGVTTQYVLFLNVANDQKTCTLANRELYSQYYEQSEMPILSQNECTWLDADANIFYNITASTNTWEQVYRVKLAYAWVTNGVITKIKTFQPLRALTYADRLTNLNAVDRTIPQAVTYNTVFTAPMDGTLFVSTDTIATDNGFADIRGLIGNKVSVQNVTSGGTVTKQLDYEYSSAGTYTINVPVEGYYTVTLVGGGGKGGIGLNLYNVNSTWGGGSGAAFVGELFLTAGSHTVTVGGANQNSTITGITAGAGQNGTGGGYNLYPKSGAGGVLSITGQTRNVTIQSNGNAGAAGHNDGYTHTAGGASVYAGYGAGGASNGSPTAGYFKLSGSYQESSQVAEIITEGELCYTHYFAGTGENRISTIIPIFKGEQFIAYTHDSQNNPNISSNIKFYPARLNTSVDL